MDDASAPESGLPWESRIGVGAFLRTLANVMLHPVQTFAAAPRDVGFVRALLFAVATSVAAVPASLFPDVFGRFSFATLAGQAPPAVDVVEKYGLWPAAGRTLVVAAVAVPLGLLMYSVVLHLMVSLAGADKPPFGRCVRAAAYHAAVVFVLGVFPVMGAVVGLPWGALVLYGATAGLFDLSRGRALAVTAGYVLGGVALQVAPVLMGGSGA